MTAALEGVEWSAARPGRSLPPGMIRYQFYRSLGGPQGWSGWAENLVPNWIRSRTFYPGSSVAMYMILLSTRTSLHYTSLHFTSLQNKITSHSIFYFYQFFLKFEIFHTKFVQKIKTHILCSVTFFSPENRPVYEIMWKNIVGRGRPQMAIWRMRVACWKPKATHTHTSKTCNTNCCSQYNNGYRNAHQYYVIRTSPFLFLLSVLV